MYHSARAIISDILVPKNLKIIQWATDWQYICGHGTGAVTSDPSGDIIDGHCWRDGPWAVRAHWPTLATKSQAEVSKETTKKRAKASRALAGYCHVRHSAELTRDRQLFLEPRITNHHGRVIAAEKMWQARKNLLSTQTFWRTKFVVKILQIILSYISVITTWMAQWH